MKVVIVHGQSHEGTTCHLARMLANKLNGDISEFFLPRDFDNFCIGCTAMKAFLDHYGYRWMVHRPEEKMFGKQAVCISTAAGMGMKNANKDMADSTFFWGCARTYKLGLRAMARS